ncbi:hypothetical protein LTR82_008065 [Friedmanniomyces endolithicus]|uniref:Uncharacterized protein n=1 Tax=Friedmanniomyces endolithicus TaxID=329885 RepID=A0AAN6FMJ4_9PEZI|nr:hypothetical protein LTR82_008065 [Friedmanniomyces endolithicus]
MAPAPVFDDAVDEIPRAAGRSADVSEQVFTAEVPTAATSVTNEEAKTSSLYEMTEEELGTHTTGSGFV